MQITQDQGGRQDQIAQFFKDTFTASEGANEGTLIHALACDLLATTPADDLRVFTADDTCTLCGCAIFTRLRFADDPRLVFLLSPMAVATEHQGKGVGQALLSHALNALRAEGVEVAVTYGDPNFYNRVGFAPVTTEMLPPPQLLKMPHGWIAQSLTDAALSPLAGPSTCAPALNHPEFW
ncbi:N-acetyltransferase [Marivita lacus]|uniref:N-acetyltransferase n=1 Tax=Marivita lacus TaxID=1323742 RepID=A0ABQ1K6T1_9RHOB|nr:N-acetyltransferase [Marivita lacus]GGB88487.1 N-acetyltransferase [Marivita lacus]